MELSETYDQYRSRIAEEAVKIVFQKLGDIILEKIPQKRGERTPDYFIKNTEGSIVAICEVKALVDSLDNKNPLETPTTYEESVTSMKKMDANHRSKLKRQLGKAITQLPVNGEITTIVCFVSFDMTDYIDMGHVLQEHIELYPEDNIPDSFILMIVHQDVVPSDSFKITQTIRMMYNTEKGKVFGQKYLDWSNAFRKAGPLPLEFNLMKRGLN